MITLQFEEAYSKLNPEQRSAVDTIEGPVMVVAGPGTGKTQVLTIRIANILLKTDVNPENILSLTFTESAVLAMRKRLMEMIGSIGYRVNINTFHGFCNQIIQDNPEDFPYLVGAQSITELEQIEILQEIISNSQFSILKPFGDPLYYVRSVLSAINDLKREGVTPEEFEKGVKKQKEDFKGVDDLYYETGINRGKMKGKHLTLQREISKNKELGSIYKSYQEELQKRRFYDYADMIMYVLEAFKKDKELLLRLQERFQYILVDEHQDTNSAQNKILELLGSFFENPNLFVVGDEKQAIFRFQGASLENFLYFKKLYPEAVLINLTANYRSQQKVLDASGSLIAKNIIPEELALGAKQLKATFGLPEEPIGIVEVEDFESEYTFLAKDIKKRLENGTLPAEIAVIFRNNKDVMPVVEAFEKYEIPFLVESDQDLLSDIDIKKFLMVLEAVENFGSDVYLVPLLHLDFLKIDPMDIFKLVKYSKRAEKSIYELLSEGKNLKELGLKSYEGLNNLYEKLALWHTESKNNNLDSLFVEVLKESGQLTQLLNKKDVLEKLNKFEALFVELKKLCFKKEDLSLGDFLNHLKLLKEHNILLKKPIKESQQRAVRLMTAHKSKGLEFEHVYIIQAFDGHWGNKRGRVSFKLPWPEIKSLVSSHPELARPEPAGRRGLAKGGRGELDQGSINNSSLDSRFRSPRCSFGEAGGNDKILSDENSDERRLFYVAMTRAKRLVTITYSKLSLDGKEQLPSQFVEEIEAEYKEEHAFNFLSSSDLPVLSPLVDEASLASRRSSGTLSGEAGGNDNSLFRPRKPIGLGIKDRAFLQSLFEAEGLSATGFINYLKCPWRYFYCNLVRIPYVADKQQSFGIAIHKAICGLLKDAGVNKTREKAENDKELLQNLYEMALRKEVFSKKDFEELLERGKKVLSDYSDNFAKSWKGDYLCEFEIKEVDLGGVKINGRIDKIEKLKGGEVIVYDLKTGKPKSRGVIEGTAKASKIAGDYMKQLYFYKLLLGGLKDARMKAKRGVIEFIEPDEKGKFHTEEFIFRKDIEGELRGQILKVAKEIKNLDFWDTRCEDKDCQYCRLRNMIKGGESSS